MKYSNYLIQRLGYNTFWYFFFYFDTSYSLKFFYSKLLRKFFFNSLMYGLYWSWTKAFFKKSFLKKTTAKLFFFKKLYSTTFNSTIFFQLKQKIKTTMIASFNIFWYQHWILIWIKVFIPIKKYVLLKKKTKYYSATHKANLSLYKLLNSKNLLQLFNTF